MVSRSSGKSKLLVFPGQLLERLREVAIRHRVSLAHFAKESLEQAVRSEEMGTSLEEALDLYELHEVQRGTRAIQIPRSNFTAMIGEFYRSQKDELLKTWRDAGKWYGEYLHARLGEGALAFFERALLVSWNLDEVEIDKAGLTVALRFTSFVMDLEITELLISYISGVMDAMGYEVVERDFVRGLARLSFGKVPIALTKR